MCLPTFLSTLSQDVAMAALSAAVHAHHGRLSRALLPLGAWRGVQVVVVESSGGGGGVLGGGEAGTGACAFQCSRSTSQVVRVWVGCHAGG